MNGFEEVCGYSRYPIFAGGALEDDAGRLGFSESDEFKLRVPRYPMAADGGVGGVLKALLPEIDEL
jgi:hypothetical protein